MASRGKSYAWALQLEVADVPKEWLSVRAQEGLGWAKELANDAVDRRDRVVLRKEPPERPWIDDIVAEEGVSEATVHRRIALARRELFGTISDSAIYKRLARRRARKHRKERPCMEPRCPEPVPAQARPNRDYCDRHSTPAARVRRHRQRMRAQNSG